MKTSSDNDLRSKSNQFRSTSLQLPVGDWLLGNLAPAANSRNFAALMHLLYLVFGTDVRNHFQANFSALSFLKQGAVLDGITVVTDAPEFYRHLEGHVSLLPINGETLREWKGEFDFFWRVKIKALEHVSKQLPGTPLLYLDSDTFLHGNLAELQARLAAGEAFMHESEGALAELRSKTEQRMWQQVRGRTVGGIKLNKRHAMWNAGVVGIPAAQAPAAIALALNICDDLSRQHVTPRLIEQFALSVALAETCPLHAAQSYIGHYWSTKDEWNKHIAGFLLESHLRKRTVADEVAALAQFDFRVAPVKRIMKNTNWRLYKLVDRTFPPREIGYAGPEV